MVDKPSLINQLIDELETLLIENRAYVTALKEASPEVQRFAERLIATAKSDPKLRSILRDKFAAFRDLSPEEVLQAIVKRLKSKDVN